MVNMRHDKSRKDPLLYIHQSKSKTPEAYMQQDYITPKDSIGRNGTQRNHIPKQNKRASGKSSYFRSPHLDAEVEQQEEEPTEEGSIPETEDDNEPTGSSRPPRDKKFKDMTLEEKVYYFAYAPALSPKLKCEVRTNNRSYRGRIVDFVENEVYMRMGRRKTPEKIPFDSIRDIRLLGF